MAGKAETQMRTGFSIVQSDRLQAELNRRTTLSRFLEDGTLTT